MQPITHSMNEYNRPQLPESVEPLIGIRELAAWLGMSPHTVKKWCSRGPESGLVPRMIIVNGVFRFRPEDVRAWLDDRSVG